MPTLKQLKDKARAIEPTIRIGKSGLTAGQIQEIVKQLKNRKLVKVKMLRSFLEKNDKKETARRLAEATDSKLIQLVGFNVVLYRR